MGARRFVLQPADIHAIDKTHWQAFVNTGNTNVPVACMADNQNGGRYLMQSLYAVIDNGRVRLDFFHQDPGGPLQVMQPVAVNIYQDGL